jgi:hypothetical protein
MCLLLCKNSRELRQTNKLCVLFQTPQVCFLQILQPAEHSQLTQAPYLCSIVGTRVSRARRDSAGMARWRARRLLPLATFVTLGMILGEH